jgi:hypothetical protein
MPRDILSLHYIVDNCTTFDDPIGKAPLSGGQPNAAQGEQRTNCSFLVSQPDARSYPYVQCRGHGEGDKMESVKLPSIVEGKQHFRDTG